MYQFYESCPFCLPHFPQQVQGESKGKFLSRLGYRVSDENDPATFELEDSYMERMIGIVSMFAAMTTIECPKNVIGIQTAWVWCARFLNLEPDTMSGPMLRAFLEVNPIFQLDSVFIFFFI